MAFASCMSLMVLSIWSPLDHTLALAEGMGLGRIGSVQLTSALVLGGQGMWSRGLLLMSCKPPLSSLKGAVQCGIPSHLPHPVPG